MAGCTAHAQNGCISTSGLKSDVTIVFLDPDFLKVAKISAHFPERKKQQKCNEHVAKKAKLTLIGSPLRAFK